jgi:hypothetical protein
LRECETCRSSSRDSHRKGVDHVSQSSRFISTKQWRIRETDIPSVDALILTEVVGKKSGLGEGPIPYALRH